ncbi:MAG: FluC/FEX family fluoride channel [Ilumatobacter sp.]|jgi:fluoride exporter|uniref:FluC/FEX family fluoride channel n=1 Tax=Ilumatobacter sp. TaxID=1967498 RepID=UPI003919637A
MTIFTVLLFATAAALGGVTRWQMTRLNSGGWPIGTLAANLLTAFAAGVASNVSATVAVVVVTALAGSTSTFSTVTGELVDLWTSGRRLASLTYGVLTVTGGIGVALCGLAIAA